MPRRRARFDQDEEGKVYRMHLSRWDRFLSIASLAFSFSFKEIGRLVDPFEDGRSRELVLIKLLPSMNRVQPSDESVLKFLL